MVVGALPVTNIDSNDGRCEVSLRERIAEALDSIPADPRPSTLVNLDRADAVIAALHLTESDGVIVGCTHD